VDPRGAGRMGPAGRRGTGSRTRLDRWSRRLAGSVLAEDRADAQRRSALLLLAVFGAAGAISSLVIHPTAFLDPLSLAGLAMFALLVLLVVVWGRDDRMWPWFIPLVAVTTVLGIAQIGSASYVLIPQMCLAVFWVALFFPARLLPWSAVWMAGAVVSTAPTMDDVAAAALVVAVALGAMLCGAFFIHAVVTEMRSANEALDDARALAEHLAATDSLTGVANRRRFTTRALEVAPLAAGQGLLLVDIDHFKRINDTHGHLVGDAVLAAVGARLAAAAPGALVARWGGEEFAVLTEPLSSSSALRMLAEHLREVVRSTPCATEPEPVWCTASIGAVRWPAGATVERALRAVDAALYAAKEAGRDRVVVAAGLRLDEDSLDVGAGGVLGSAALPGPAGQPPREHERHAQPDRRREERGVVGGLLPRG
jgi:diguanylate cyclase (GGDEF)-like protein